MKISKDQIFIPFSLNVVMTVVVAGKNELEQNKTVNNNSPIYRDSEFNFELRKATLFSLKECLNEIMEGGRLFYEGQQTILRLQQKRTEQKDCKY